MKRKNRTVKEVVVRSKQHGFKFSKGRTSLRQSINGKNDYRFLINSILFTCDLFSHIYYFTTYQLSRVIFKSVDVTFTLKDSKVIKIIELLHCNIK